MQNGMLSQILQSPRHGQLVRLLVALDAGVTPHMLPFDVNIIVNFSTLNHCVKNNKVLLVGNLPDVVGLLLAPDPR